MCSFETVVVFPAGPGGGNPAPVVLAADGMGDVDMRAVARETGHESAFVFSPPADTGCDFAFRFWVPNHEMEMCGHAAVGATWLLAKHGRLPGDRISISTRSGPVEARIRRAGEAVAVEVSQPVGRVEAMPSRRVAEIAEVLGIGHGDLAPYPVVNAATSRAKTLVPLRNVEVLHGLAPRLGSIEALCTAIGSTGLYPYAPVDLDEQVFEARQFPRSSGYPEDAATGIAATALGFGLLDHGLIRDVGRPVTIRQGRAMGRPSEITVRFEVADGKVAGCWLGGRVEWPAQRRRGPTGEQSAQEQRMV